MFSGGFGNPLYFFATNTSNVTQAEMWVRLPDILEFFFVAHPSSGRREGEEHNRIMTVSTQKSDHVYIQVEECEFLIGLALSKKKNQQKFKERLEYFFGRYLPLLKLHRDKVLYYSISRRDLPSLFRYLTQSLLPMSIGDELDYQSRSTHGRFLRGPSDITLDTPLVGDDALPTVHIYNYNEVEDNEELVKYQMMVYRSLNATVCMFTTHEVTRRLMRNIDGYLGSELSKVASQIGDCVGAQNADTLSTPDFHYIYYNPASLSLTSSFTDSTDAPKAPLPPPEVNKLVCSSLTGFLSEADEFGECFAKSESEWWIVLKKTMQWLTHSLPLPGYHVDFSKFCIVVFERAWSITRFSAYQANRPRCFPHFDDSDDAIFTQIGP
ncbi:hypothetical protein ANCCEY_08868 [Ancylostoma ceylanicum]|uniref:CCZ1/INTU/HSP4 first Longin domain-containing protein n=1 Tax=Ancylostoma ceylanicum TaxID=53326 RepID=A0A0D6LLH1_9BILA|nr:hypothetical protein ANCCEY_08868 [Ancylostoma ceylanicum]